jgi:hypothetical protein
MKKRLVKRLGQNRAAPQSTPQDQRELSPASPHCGCDGSAAGLAAARCQSPDRLSLTKLVRARGVGVLGHFEPRIRSNTAEPWLYASSSVLNVSEDCVIMVGLVTPRTISQPKPLGPDFRALTTSRRGGRPSSTAGLGGWGRLATPPAYPRYSDLSVVRTGS